MSSPTATPLSVSLDGLVLQSRSTSRFCSFNGRGPPLSPSLRLSRPLLLPLRSRRCSSLRSGEDHSSSSSSSSSSSPSPSPSSSSILPPSQVAFSLFGDPPRAGTFLGPDAGEKLRFLEGFRYLYEFPHGSLEVRLMGADEVAATAKLLAESFADSVFIPSRYTHFLEFLVVQYVAQKRAQLPHAATLLGIYREEGAAAAAEGKLACTAEVSFNVMGSNVSSPSPPPPRDVPYICNMTVEQSLRRRGIGWHLLKACEELISKMSPSAEVYLHCRVIDEGPLSMYNKAGYSIIETDSFFVWLKLQQRKHLMRKQLAASCE